ncbi:hypothetical protein Taro_023535, partial [Colocasia esculenta]|nr:hypothetical protein [Colocasia esculenta]
PELSNVRLRTRIDLCGQVAGIYSGGGKSEANTYSGGGKSVSGSASPSPLAPLPLLPPPAEKIPPKKSRNHPLAALRQCPPPSASDLRFEGVLFNDTIFHNIHYGRLAATEKEVYDAARCAAIHDTIMNFPEKYSTIVGERGLKVGALLCDEATSALDSMTEAEILLSLKTLSRNRTSIFIAHRLTTAMQCDEVIVLENGKVVEQGSHDDLLSRAGRYAQLWFQQNNGENVDTINIT